MKRLRDEKDKAVFSILTHGEKQRVEIISIIQAIDNRTDDSIGNQLNKIVDYYDVIEKEKRNNKSFYRRTDLDPNPFEIIRPRSPADPAIVDELLSALETRVFATNADISSSTTPPRNRMDTIQALMEISMSKKYILKEDLTLNRYLQIFDEYLDIMRVTYLEPEKSGSAGFPEIEHRRFIQLTIELVSKSKRGQEHLELWKRLKSRVDNIEKILLDVPEGIGFEFLGLVRSISDQDAKELFIKMVKSGNYDNEDLEREAYYTYDVHNDIHDLLSALGKIGNENGNEVQQKVQKLEKNIANNYVNNFER